ncbi:hypothetical protein [Streptosporangium sp. 'caverna']|uniref:hypothetical protein n=1 Tax=Streptosporangium sp. 'caverna' TaxID=2202249 RepID=UPI000D7D9EB4|nr:hypothetical protein [Streptosporangium sp. 'caverna']AWS47190.1 hypothetical protein DKM19_43725 [Streptosporangium sp. 'caverna']
MTAFPIGDTEDREDSVTDATAEQHDKALAVVQRLLKARGVRAYAAHTIGLRLLGTGGLHPLGESRRYAPELIVHSGAGWVFATVTVGARSGCYLVSLWNGFDLRTVKREHPEKVADLILSIRPEERA